MNTFSEQLRVAVQESLWHNGAEQRELARRAGLHESLISRFLRGQRGLSFEVIDTVLGAAGLEVVIRPRRERKEV
jgi:transcriptional regulator with XRE-family HTH domain